MKISTRSLALIALAFAVLGGGVIVASHILVSATANFVFSI